MHGPGAGRFYIVMYKCSRIVHNIIILRRLRRAPEADAVAKDDENCRFIRRYPASGAHVIIKTGRVPTHTQTHSVRSAVAAVATTLPTRVASVRTIGIIIILYVLYNSSSGVCSSVRVRGISLISARPYTHIDTKGHFG